MKINVFMLAFHEDIVRVVEISDNSKNILDDVFYWGQNDFQPQNGICSVSVGDVIEHNGLHIILPIGFKEITPAQLAEYKKVPRRDRYFYVQDTFAIHD